jgi:flagellar M-ring protein FliF
MWLERMEQRTAIVEGSGNEPAQRPAGPFASPWFQLAKALGAGRIIALGLVACTLLGFFAYIVGRATDDSYTLLFSGLALTDAQELVGRLEAMGTPYRLSPGGDAILVPSGDALRLRMALAEEGMPVGGTVGYELLDRANPFTTSDFLANVNLRRAIEGELARTIGTLHSVRSARVHIVVPERTMFGRDQPKATASIVLTLRGPDALDKRQIAGIRQLVAAAVPGLAADSVTLVDGAGNLLAEPSDPGAAGLSASDSETYRVALEDRLRGKLVQLLERSVGLGKVDAAVSADLDFDEVATTAEQYDPQSQVARSTQSAEENSDQTESQPAAAVGAAGNLPTERAANAGSGPASTDKTKKTEETVNYEISRTVRNQTKRGASIRRLSIAVQVDGLYSQRPDGTIAYEPRGADEMAQLAALVRSAAGVDEGRGDVVEVVSRQFAAAAPAEAGREPGWQEALSAQYGRFVDLGVLSALTLAVLFFGVRPALRRVLAAVQPPAPPPSATAVVLGADGKPLLVHGATGATIGVDRAGNPVVVREPIAAEPSPARLTHGTGGEAAQGELIDLKNVRGPVQASLLGQVTRAIEDSPEDAVRVVRSWLHNG